MVLSPHNEPSSCDLAMLHKRAMFKHVMEGKNRKGSLSWWTFLRSIQRRTEELQLSDLVERDSDIPKEQLLGGRKRSSVKIHTFVFLGRILATSVKLPLKMPCKLWLNCGYFPYLLPSITSWHFNFTNKSTSLLDSPTCSRKWKANRLSFTDC